MPGISKWPTVAARGVKEAAWRGRIAEIALAATILLAMSFPTHAADATVAVDAAQLRQKIDGWSVDERIWDDPHLTETFRPPNPGEEPFGRSAVTIPLTAQNEILERLFNELGLTDVDTCDEDRGMQEVRGGSYDFRWKKNDGHVDWVKQAIPHGLKRWHIKGRFLESWMSKTDPADLVEYTMAKLRRWRDLGYEPQYVHARNEPSYQNGLTPVYLRELIRGLGRKIRAEGFKTKIIATDELGVDGAYNELQVIMADAEVRGYVDAISFHYYSSGSSMAYVEKMRDDFSVKYNKPMWMTEFTRGSLARTSYKGSAFNYAKFMNDLLARNVSHINYEWGYFGQWESPDLHLLNITYDAANNYTGYTIDKAYYTFGQYSRFVPEGSQRVDAASSSSTVGATAFKNGNDLIIVAVNDQSTPKSVAFNLSGVTGISSMRAIRTSNTENWKDLPAIAVSGNSFTTVLPAQSVTTFIGSSGPVTKYTLAVNSGTGDGSYSAGTVVSISANTPPAGQEFDKWTGATVANALDASTTLTMPAANTAVTATFRAVTTKYTLTVNSGTGDGSYSAGTVVSISANAPPAGQEFDKWTGATIANALADSTTLTMPAANTTVTATYRDQTGGPIAYWRFDEGSGTAATDASGNGHNGTLKNNPVWVAGAVNTGLSFNPGLNNYVAVADFNPPSSISLEAWIFPLGNAGTDSIILDKHNSEYDFRVNDKGFLTGVAGGVVLADATFNFYDNVNASKWYHVAYTFDAVANTHKLYRNGVEVASGANTGTISNQSTALWIGRQSQYNFGTFKGTLDEVKLYGRALSSSEVQNDYLAATKYTLVVNSGTGDGSYSAGTVVSISASTPPAGQEFDKWTGATVANAASASTTLTMPAANTTVTATYRPVTTYTLTVNSGTGDGSYSAGTVVSISASTPPAGQVFDKWTGTTVANALAASTTLTMPAANTTVTATYRDQTGNPPVITSSASATPNPALVGQTVAFSCAATGSGTLAYSWDFGDGSSGTGATASHAFAGAGTYTATVTVTSSSGTATSSVVVVVNGAGPIAYWRFDEGSGTAATDASGNGHNGTLKNNPVWVAGAVNTGLSFNPGLNNYVAVADFNPPSSISLEAWIFTLGNAGTDSIILSKHNSEYDFRINEQGFLSAGAGGGRLVDATFNFYDNANSSKWYHVAYTFDAIANTHKLYRNGVEVASGANTKTIANQSTALWIGRQSQYNFGTFKGTLDEVKIYDRALDGAEISAAAQSAQAPASAFVAPEPLSTPMPAESIGKFAAKVNLKDSGRDSATLSGILPVDSQSFAGETISIDLQGAAYAFEIDGKGRGKSKDGSIVIRAKRSASKRSARKSAQGVPFRVRIRNGSWASLWQAQNMKEKGVVELQVSLTIKGVTYTAPISTRFVSKGERVSLKK